MWKVTVQVLFIMHIFYSRLNGVNFFSHKIKAQTELYHVKGQMQFSIPVYNNFYQSAMLKMTQTFSSTTL